ncbi:MAG: hypothetical protein JJ906_05440 [Roseitalea sp.]|nr:hypothetical protein [Roseitalea sp.]
MIEDINIRLLATGEWLARRTRWLAAPFGLLLLVAFTLTVAAAAWAFPIYNWDMFAYFAAAHEAPGISVEALHRHAYETMRQNAPAGDFIVLTQDRDYRVRQYADPEAFFTMLGFYRVKLLYVEAIRWLSTVTDPYTALRLLSVMPAALTGGLVIWWLARERALHLAPLAVALLLVGEFGESAREGTPDALSTMLFVAAMLAFMARREALVAILLFIAFLARPDHAAYIGVLWFVSIFTRTFSWGAFVAFAAAAIVYVPMTQAGGHPGWWVHFWFTHVDFGPTLEGFDPDFSLAVYAYAVVRVIVRSLVEETWLAIVLLGCFAWWRMALRGIAFSRRETTVLVTTLLAIGAKMVVFPLHETRFHLPYLIAFGLVLICALRGLRFLPGTDGVSRQAAPRSAA